MRVVVIGGGFGGMAAIKTIYKAFPADDKSAMPEIILIDKHDHSTMLPSLPDIAGMRIEPEFAIGKYSETAPNGVKIIKACVEMVDFQTKSVVTEKETYVYDYLVFASGSVANFYNNTPEFIVKCHKLDTLEDALKLKDGFTTEISNFDTVNVVISGGGFTGLELATNLYHRAKYAKKKVNIYMIELCDRILPMLGEKRSKYVTNKMKALGIEFLTSESVVSFEERKVTLKSGKIIDNTFFCWCSGVKMGLKAIGSHTVKDEKLSTKERTMYLRRAVNFAYMQGKIAGKNILASLKVKEYKPYKMVDLGWVIPLYTTSIGEAFGKKIQGRKGIAMHYIICGVKNYSFKNLYNYCKFAIIFMFTKE
ncbi:MAG: FAD-dependent oxidoreductase [Fusobacteria bacterium]|nr:FAD-dependent oxidoreductase [Fusobacteriota bacterium]